MTNHVCFECDKPIVDIDDYKMYALDVPYVNLFFHKGCFIKIGGYGNIVVYVTENQKKVYNPYINIKKGGKNK
jgi:hypothetical protein